MLFQKVQFLLKKMIELFLAVGPTVWNMMSMFSVAKRKSRSPNLVLVPLLSNVETGMLVDHHPG